MCIWGGGNVADGVACTFDGNHVNRCVTETCDQVQATNAVLQRAQLLLQSAALHLFVPGKLPHMRAIWAGVHQQG
jgi:hypothetical protein